MNMLFTFVLIILILIALGAIAWVVVPKFSLLSSLRVQQSPKDKLKQLKKNIVVGRLLRKAKAIEEKLLAPETRRKVKDLVKDSYTKLKVLEEKYRAHTGEAKGEMLLKRGQDNIVDDPELAEQCFIEVINLDRRNLEAYVGLFQIYLAKKKFDEVGEVVDFLIKINPASADKYVFSLAEAYLQNGDIKTARKYGEQALKIEVGNPRYLDFMTDLAILDNNKKQAEAYLERLEETNPENAKIAEFKERIKGLA